MRSVVKAVLWLTVFTTVSTLCAVIVINTLRSPVRGARAWYTATFSDVSGLFPGDDVRISGVQVGKVEAVRLVGRTAEVDMTVLADHPVYPNSDAAVRYQNLLGQRYVELVQPAAAGDPLPPGSTIPIEQTIPSFDVTRLFNGFRPIFEVLDPAQLNQFGENLLSIIQGDETGIGPFLRDLDRLSTFAVDRQAVLKVLIGNLAAVAHDLNGKSTQLFDLIDILSEVLGKFNSKWTEFAESIDRELPTIRNAARLLQYIERIFDGSTVPLYDLLGRMWPQTPTIIGGLSLVPSLIQGMRDSLIDDEPAQPAFACSNGEVTLPGIGQVSFAHQNLVVCRG